MANDTTISTAVIQFSVEGADKMASVLADYKDRVDAASAAEKGRAASLAAMRRATDGAVATGARAIGGVGGGGGGKISTVAGGDRNRVASAATLPVDFKIPQVALTPQQQAANDLALHAQTRQERAGRAEAMAGAMGTSDGRKSVGETVSAGGRENLAVLQQAVEIERERAKFAGSPAGVEARKKEVALTRELMAAERQANWKQKVADVGVFGAYVGAATDKVGAFAKSLEPLGGVMSSVWSAGTSGILSLVAAADPSLMSSFQGNLKLLAIEIGSAFVPAIEWATGAVKGVTQWIAGLDEGLKSTVARVALGAVALAGLGVAGMKLYGAFQMAGTAVMGFGKILTLGMGWWGLAITGLTAAVTYFSGAWDKVKDAITGASGAMRGVQHGVGGLGMPGVEKQKALRDEIGTLPEGFRKQLLGPEVEKMKPAEFQRIVGDIEKDVTEKISTARQGNAPAVAREERLAQERQAIIDPEMMQLRKEHERLLRKYQVESGEVNASAFPQRSAQGREMDKAISETVSRIIETGKVKGVDIAEEAQKIRSYVTGGTNLVKPPYLDVPRGVIPPREVAPQAGGTPLPQLQAQQETLKRIRDLIGAGAGLGQQPVAEDIKTPIQARYTTATAFRDSVQLQALNVTETEAQIAQKQMENLDKRLGDGNGLLKQMVDNQEALIRALEALKWSKR